MKKMFISKCEKIAFEAISGKINKNLFQTPAAISICDIYLVNVNNGNLKTTCELCLKLTIKTNLTKLIIYSFKI